jgi:ribonucleoside-diphosphate reductase beta chain
MGIFDKRIAYQPFEYDVDGFTESINHSYWLFSEWNFISDVQDFNVSLTDNERNVIKNTLLAISQIEVSVKKFWAKLGDKFPKAEFDQVGITFGESEVRHAKAYSHLLKVLGMNDEFDMLLENPVFQGRVDYLTKYLKGAGDSSNESYALTLTLFSLFIENVSLFSQFAIIKSFNKNRNLLKDIDNVVQATQQEEQIHAQFGAKVINIIKSEYPEWFDAGFYDKVIRASRKAYVAECAIVDWIFEQGELPFLSKDSIKEFIKSRFNYSLEMIGCPQAFEVDKDKLKPLKWFDEELIGETNNDFFNKKSVTYSKKVQAITGDDLF